ncbi:hypothetical protein TNCV_3961671 [Trichonephila clavipes]|nr:hypothetical protein TNCV_3961671 [Trichonephila clavipes]
MQLHPRRISELDQERSDSPKKFKALKGANNPEDVIVTEIGPSAATFLSVFADAVKASAILIQIFDMSRVSVQEYSQFIYE